MINLSDNLQTYLRGYADLFIHNELKDVSDNFEQDYEDGKIDDFDYYTLTKFLRECGVDIVPHSTRLSFVGDGETFDKFIVHDSISHTYENALRNCKFNELIIEPHAVCTDRYTFEGCYVEGFLDIQCPFSNFRNSGIFYRCFINSLYIENPEGPVMPIFDMCNIDEININNFTRPDNRGAVSDLIVGMFSYNNSDSDIKYMLDEDIKVYVNNKQYNISDFIKRNY